MKHFTYRHVVLDLLDFGYTKQQVADRFGWTRQTIYNILDETSPWADVPYKPYTEYIASVKKNNPSFYSAVKYAVFGTASPHYFHLTRRPTARWTAYTIRLLANKCFGRDMNNEDARRILQALYHYKHS